MKTEMLINSQHDECRIALVVDGAMNELYTERASHVSSVGNIYKGRVTNVEPSIQAAFVDFSKIKNGFLHISDLHPQYFPSGQRHVEAVGKKRARRDRPPIQACLRRGQEVVVQVTKEGIGTKGATLTTYLSIPGRFLVLMPGMHRLGVSRKIEDETDRTHMRQILEDLKPPPEVGFIVRTAGLDRPKRELQRDMAYLTRLWESVQAKNREVKAPAELYQESDLVIRTIRDVYNTDIQRIICDNELVAVKIKEFLKLTMPRSANRVELYEGQIGLFHAFGLEQELENMNSARVPLPSGGSLIIEQAEALVAIDVNSGRLRETDSAEMTALRTNLEAVREATRQLRLRDMGGVIIIDFIDMVEERHRRQIENLLRDELKKDRARTKPLRISRFGIVEMTRQRIRPPLHSSIFQTCPACGGAGRVKSQESQSLAVLRVLSLASIDDRIGTVELSVSPGVADFLLNVRRDELVELERSCQKRILIRSSTELPPGEYRILCKDSRGSEVHWEPAQALAKSTRDVATHELTNELLADFRARQRAAGQQEPVTGDFGPVEVETPQPEGIQPSERQELLEQMRQAERDIFAEPSEGGPEPEEAAEEPQPAHEHHEPAVPEHHEPVARERRESAAREHRQPAGQAAQEQVETAAVQANGAHGPDHPGQPDGGRRRSRWRRWRENKKKRKQQAQQATQPGQVAPAAAEPALSATGQMQQPQEQPPPQERRPRPQQQPRRQQPRQQQAQRQQPQQERPPEREIQKPEAAEPAQRPQAAFPLLPPMPQATAAAAAAASAPEPVQAESQQPVEQEQAQAAAAKPKRRRVYRPRKRKTSKSGGSKAEKARGGDVGGGESSTPSADGAQA